MIEWFKNNMEFIFYFTGSLFFIVALIGKIGVVYWDFKIKKLDEKRLKSIEEIKNAPLLSNHIEGRKKKINEEYSDKIGHLNLKRKIFEDLSSFFIKK